MNCAVHIALRFATTFKYTLQHSFLMHFTINALIIQVDGADSDLSSEEEPIEIKSDSDEDFDPGQVEVKKGRPRASKRKNEAVNKE